MQMAERMQLSTIRIETTKAKEKHMGTGFFFNFKYDEKTDQGILAVVTNRHVIEGAKEGTLKFTMIDANGNPLWGKYSEITPQTQNFENLWIPHKEEDVELAILPLKRIQDDMNKLGSGLHCAFLAGTDVLNPNEYSAEFSRIEDITIVGYPDEINDDVNNIPITRRGITATPLQCDFYGRPEFLVDAAVYPGSSGSPVFVFNQGSYPTPRGGLRAGASRLKLVGIIYGGYCHEVNEKLKLVNSQESKASVLTLQTDIPSNLGVAIHVRKLLEFEAML